MGIDQRAEGMEPEPELDGSGLRVAIAVGRFNSAITSNLLRGAREGLSECRIDPGAVTVEWVPGTFELPFAVKTLAATGRFDAVIALGCVIRGDTAHFDYVAGEGASGIMDAQLSTGVPCIFGVLTTDTVEQAEVRSVDGPDNKGREAARTGVEMALFVRRVTNP